ncbi:MAG: phosphodiester glycosidase family protein [Armatimonadetes bacterium]|nr:phosphodiester glycosidase family protein [Armatimonadota bacterium]
MKLFFRPAVLFAALFSCSCVPPAPADTAPVTVTPGVVFERHTGFQTLAVDLDKANVVPAVVAQNVTRQGNNFVGDAFTVRDWCEKRGAVAGINGGFFGQSYDDLGTRKQIVQLCVVDGKVVAPGSDTPSTRTPGERYLRSAIGFHADGTPEIVWATGTVKNVIRAYGSPTNPDTKQTWANLRSAVACGPRLYAGGVRRISDKEERLVSEPALIRAFVAYDTGDTGKPRHFVMGRADAATYAQVADFLAVFYKKQYGTEPIEAMCLDGGSSGQIVYEKNGRLVDAEATGVRVPTAILLLPRRTVEQTP